MPQAVVIHAAHDLRIEERPVPRAGAGQVAVAIQTGGICGSDLHYYNHGGFGAVRLREPMVLGHEVAGQIAEIGPDVHGLDLDQLVAVSPSRPCKSCEYCQKGFQNHCLNMRFYGSAMPFPHIQGAFRDVLVVDATQCVPADGLDPALAAMAEPLAVALHAVGQAGPLMGKTVMVTGCGPIGVLCILAARRAGAGHVIASDLTDFTLEIARKCGAEKAIKAGDDSALSSYRQGKGQVDVMFECSGSAAALADGIACLRPRGTLIQLGLGGDMNIPMQALTAKEISLRGSFRFHEEFATAVHMMQHGLIDPRPLITHSFPLEAVHAAFDMAGDRNLAMKVQIAF